MNFHGQTVIVAGGSGSVGRAVVCMLAERGAHVLASYHTNQTQAQTLLTLGQALAGEIAIHPLDVCNQASVDALVTAALTRWGQIDGLINCFGQMSYTPTELIEDSQWAESLTLNLDGVYRMCRAVLRPMMRRRVGRIVTVAALHGVAGGPAQADYSAATGGILGLTRALAREAAPWQITVNAITPGLIESPQLAVIPEAQRSWGEQVIALGRVGQPDEIAAAAVFLASPLASYITGVTLPVDGGWRMA